MPCDTRARPGQTLTERKGEVRQAIDKLSAAPVSGRAKAIVGPQGAVAFQGWTEGQQANVTDACALRMILATGSALAKASIAKAEAIAGRGIDRQAIAHGVHSHDFGKSWHHGH